MPAERRWKLNRKTFQRELELANFLQGAEKLAMVMLVIFRTQGLVLPLAAVFTFCVVQVVAEV